MPLPGDGPARQSGGPAGRRAITSRRPRPAPDPGGCAGAVRRTGSTQCGLLGPGTALNGLRVSEATGADIEHLGLERGHRTLTITRKGGKVLTIPLAPRTARVIDLATGERCDGPVFLTHDGRRLDRHGAGRIVRKVARRAGISKNVGPHTLRHAFITAALDAGVPLRDVQEAASHADPEPQCGTTGPAAAWTGTLPTSSPPTSPAPPGNRTR